MSFVGLFTDLYCPFHAPPSDPQVRLLDGSTITTAFKAQEPLAAVRVYIQMNSNTPEGQDFTLLSPYPRHVYTEQDMEKPLKELGELEDDFKEKGRFQI